MGNGAIFAAAAVAAAKRRRTKAILDAFRLAGATETERADSLDGIGLSRSSELDDLVTSGVIIAGSRTGTWYLSEAAYVKHRDAPPTRLQRVLALLLFAFVLLGGALLIGLGEGQR